MSDDRSAALGVIPARYGATRFPGKPLASLWGKPLLQHVWERGRRVPGLEIVVATDDERIASAARAWGATVEMTSAACATGTDRVAEVARRRPDAGIVVNLQGDEPELDHEAVQRLIETMRRNPTIAMATLAHREDDRAVLASEHVVKVEVDATGRALYFTRRGPDAAQAARVLRHVGVYGFTRSFLLEFASWPPGSLEQSERLEQLRALERGVGIHVIVTSSSGAGVDTPEELAALEQRGPGGRSDG